MQLCVAGGVKGISYKMLLLIKAYYRCQDISLKYSKGIIVILITLHNAIQYCYCIITVVKFKQNLLYTCAVNLLVFNKCTSLSLIYKRRVYCPYIFRIALCLKSIWLLYSHTEVYTI